MNMKTGEWLAVVLICIAIWNIGYPVIVDERPHKECERRSCPVGSKAVYLSPNCFCLKLAE